MSSIKNPASTVTQGRVEKHLPDTYFINSQDRWLTTTGAEKGSTRRSIQDTGNVKRPDCPTNYSGPAGNAENPSTYAPKNFEPSRRPEFGAPEVPASNAAGKGPSTDGDGFIKSYTNYTNNRATTTTASPFGIVGTMVSAAMAPIMDVLSPTRKEETIHNARLYGDVGSSVANSYVINKNETAPTTVKETTLTSTQFNINNQSEGQYVNNAVAPDATQRDTTGCSHIGSSGGVGTSTGNMVYNAAYSQTNNDIKSSTIHNRQNQGGTQMFNQNMNLTTVPADTTRFDGRVNPPSSIVTYSPAVESYGNVNTPQSFSQESDSSRIDPNLLSAFKKNPYTHSLTGVV